MKYFALALAISTLGACSSDGETSNRLGDPFSLGDGEEACLDVYGCYHTTNCDISGVFEPGTTCGDLGYTVDPGPECGRQDVWYADAQCDVLPANSGGDMGTSDMGASEPWPTASAETHSIGFYEPTRFLAGDAPVFSSPGALIPYTFTTMGGYINPEVIYLNIARDPEVIPPQVCLEGQPVDACTCEDGTASSTYCLVDRNNVSECVCPPPGENLPDEIFLAVPYTMGDIGIAISGDAPIGHDLPIIDDLRMATEPSAEIAGGRFRGTVRITERVIDYPNGYARIAVDLSNVTGTPCLDREAICNADKYDEGETWGFTPNTFTIDGTGDSWKPMTRPETGPDGAGCPEYSDDGLVDVQVVSFCQAAWSYYCEGNRDGVRGSCEALAGFQQTSVDGSNPADKCPYCDRL